MNSTSNTASSYNIFMIKEGVSANDVVKKDKYDEEHHIPAGETPGTLYLSRPKEKEVTFLREYRKYNHDVPEFNTGRVSALFLTQAGVRLFAIAHGSARFWFREGVVEEKFGLLAALNLLGPQKLKGLQTATLSTNPLVTDQRLARSSNHNDFRLDPFSDLINSIKGRSVSEDSDDLPMTLDGGDSLKVTAAIDLPEMSTYLGYFCDAFEQELPKEFEWVNRIKPVKDKPLERDLDQRILVEIMARNPTGVISLMPPLLMGETTISAYRFADDREARPFSDPSLENYIATRNPAKFHKLTVEKLKSQKVEALDEDGEVVDKWSVYHCLCGEIEIDDAQYVRYLGKWYQVHRELYDRVSADLAAVPVLDMGLPDWNLPKENPKKKNLENEYNNLVADTWEYGRVHVLDTEDVRYQGQDKYEHCDLMHEDGRMIHVKRYGSSATLGHLFNQGKVSARSFAGSKKARASLQKILPPELDLGDPDQPINPADYHIVFAIATEQDGVLSLPFFARLVLRDVYRELHHELGFQVSLTKIRLIPYGRTPGTGNHGVPKLYRPMLGRHRSSPNSGRQIAARSSAIQPL